MSTQVPEQAPVEIMETLAEATNGVIHVPYVVYREHVARVETLCNLLERLGEAIATSPYAAMLPADLVNDLRGK